MIKYVFMFGHHSKHWLVSPVICSEEPWLTVTQGRKLREMLYYIWLYSNECHVVVVTSVSPDRDTAMQGRGRGCQAGGTGVVEPGCCSQGELLPERMYQTCWSLDLESHRLVAPWQGLLPASGGPGHCQKPEKYPGLIHLVFHFQTVTEVFGGPTQKGDESSTVGLGGNANQTLLCCTMPAPGIQACAEGEGRAFPKRQLQVHWSQQELLQRSSVSSGMH